MDQRQRILLTLLGAMRLNISKNVRGICCDWDDNYEWFKIIFYLDVEPNDQERELQSVIMTEFHNEMQKFKKFYEDCIYDPRPFSQLNKLREVIFWRDEVIN